MDNYEEILEELREEYHKCDELFNIAYELNGSDYTRTAFTQKVTSYMSEVIQTLGFLIGEFEREWDVKIIPPFGGAVIRFHIDHNGKHVSVYFDGYSELGYMVDENDKPIPYWEYYDGEECYRYYIDESEQMMEDIKRFLESE